MRGLVKRTKWGTAGLIAGIVMALSIPAVAINNAGGNRSVTETVSAGGEFGNLGASWYSDGTKHLYAFGINPEGGMYGGAFDCQFWGDGDVTMPTYQRIGLDRVRLTGSIPSDDFDYCVGDYPDIVTYDIEILAETVYKEVNKRHQIVLKGDGYESKTTSTWISGNGDGEGAVTGTFQGVEITGWTYGGYSFIGYNEGGGPTTTLAP